MKNNQCHRILNFIDPYSQVVEHPSPYSQQVAERQKFNFR